MNYTDRGSYSLFYSPSYAASLSNTLFVKLAIKIEAIFF